MPELIDYNWFITRTSSSETLNNIRNVIHMQKVALEENIMPIDNIEMTFELDGEEVFLERSSAVNGLEIYQEIFRDKDHFVHNAFSPTGKEKIIDLGANYGFYSMFVKKNNVDADIFCVEPNPYIFEALNKNLTNFSGIKTLNCAVASIDKEESFELVRQLPSIGGKTLRQVKRKWLNEELIQTIPMQYLSLESIFIESGFSECDILKIDIEGAEEDLILNTSSEVLHKAKSIVMERHSEEIHRNVIRRLTDIGFSLVYDSDPKCTKHYGNLYFLRNK